MSLFENIKLTNNGLNLQSKAQVGKMLKFTNIKIGDGKIGSTPVSIITDLKNFKLTIELNKFKVLTDGQAVIGGILSNTSVTEGFYWREIGLYAEDPDTGLEILYAYGNCGDLAEFIPAVDSNTIIEKVVNIIILTSNMENVTASINNSLSFATQQELEEFKDEINLMLKDFEHTHNASEITGGTFDGKVVANADATSSLDTFQVRNIKISNVDLEAGKSALATGSIVLVYEE